MKTVFYFTADWCNPCKKVKPVVEDLIRDGYLFQVIDVDIEKDFARSFEIKSVPTFIAFENNKEINRVTGSQTKQSLLEFIK